MSTISVSLPSDGQTIDAADYNVPINTIVSLVNGNLDSNNISTGGIVGSNVASGTITGDKLASANFQLLTVAQSADGSATSMTDWITVGTAAIPAWCTTVYVIITLSGVFPVTAVNTMTIRAKLGSATGATQELYDTNTPVNQDVAFTLIETFASPTTGNQSLIIQQSRTGGANGIRSDGGSKFTAVLIYK